MKKTNGFIENLRRKVKYFNEGGILVPFPGTQIYEAYKNIVGFSEWWLGKWHPYEAFPKVGPYHFFPYNDKQN